MRRIAALTVSALVALGSLALVAPQAGAASMSSNMSGSKACPATKSSKSSSMSGMDMGSSSSSKKSKMSNCPTVAGAPQIAVTASAFSFTPADITIKAGEPVTIVLTSTDLEHDFTVQKYGHVVHAMPKKTAKGGLVIDTPGTYKFWCTVKGHKANGMIGTITVTP